MKSSKKCRFSKTFFISNKFPGPLRVRDRERVHCTHIIELDNLRQNKISILPFFNFYLIKIFMSDITEFNLTSNKTILSSAINFINQKVQDPWH